MPRGPSIRDTVTVQPALNIPTAEENAAETRRLVEKMARQIDKLGKEVTKVRAELTVMEKQASDTHEAVVGLGRLLVKGPSGRITSVMIERLFLHAGLQ